jgi:hypothetical protein
MSFLKGDTMQLVQTGQCGVCAHFGEHHADNEQLIQIRTTKQAPVDYVDECGKNDDIHLKVTALSGCDGFEPADAA